MVSLLQLPPELVHHILSYVEPRDLGNITRTCRFLKHSLEGNKAVYRSIYRRTLDKLLPSKKLNWEREIHDLLLLQRICSSQVLDKKSYLPFVLETVVRLLRNASRIEDDDWHTNHEGRRFKIPGVQVPLGTEASNHYVPLRRLNFPPPSKNIDFLSTLFSSDEIQEAFLTRSFIFERARGGTKYFQSPPDPMHQQSAKLHSLFGMALPMHNHLKSRKTATTRASSNSIVARIYPFACSKVYDLREYTSGSGWGPFLNDGSWRVDWEKVEAVLLVIQANLWRKGLDKFPIFWALWGVPFAGSWPGSYWSWGSALHWGNEGPVTEGEDEEKYEEKREKTASEGNGEEEAENLKDKEDPYGVTGTWLRVVCFVDYNDFFNYNFPVGDPIPDNVPRPLLDVGEATRLITMKIRVTNIEDPGEDDHPDYPVVTYRGKCRSLDFSELWDDSADSDIRGTVRTTPEGEIRWTSYSVFSGEERWKSEGIQIGGMKSGRGVVGNWFEKNHNPHGPCGPTAYWKISNRVPAKDGDEEEGDRLCEFLISDFRNRLQSISDEDSSTDEDSESDSSSEGYEGDEEREENDMIERGSEEMNMEDEDGEYYEDVVEVEGDELEIFVASGVLRPAVEGDFTNGGLGSQDSDDDYELTMY